MNNEVVQPQMAKWHWGYKFFLFFLSGSLHYGQQGPETLQRTLCRSLEVKLHYFLQVLYTHTTLETQFQLHS